MQPRTRTAVGAVLAAGLESGKSAVWYIHLSVCLSVWVDDSRYYSTLMTGLAGGMDSGLVPRFITIKTITDGRGVGKSAWVSWVGPTSRAAAPSERLKH